MQQSNNLIEKTLNIEKLDSLLNKFSIATGLTVGLLEHPSQKIIFMHGDNNTCKKFHWKSEKASAICRMSRSEDTSKLNMPGDTYIGVCPNGLTHGCTPINLDGKHIATIFLGQMFFEKPDLKKFEKQAKRFNFDVDEYIISIKQLPVINKEKFKAHLDYLSDLAVMITEMTEINLNNLLKKQMIELQEKNLQTEIISRKQIEEILKDAQAKFLAISEAAKDAIILINSNGLITYCNPAVEKLLNYTCDELLAKNVHKLIAPKEYHPTAIKQFNHFSITGDGNALGKTLELPALKKDGTQIIIELSVSPLRLNNQWNAIGIIRDITRKKELENELKKERNKLKDTVEEKTQELKQSLAILENTNMFLEESNKSKTRFMQSVSHELRTPLNAIMGFTQLLNQQIYGELNNSQCEYVSLINDSSNKLLSLINNLLSVTQIDAGTLELKQEMINLENFINEMISIMYDQFKTKNIELTYIPKTPNITIKADRSKLREVLYNLLSNACKYTPNGGKTEISTEKGNGQVKISVKDTGIGIQPENIEKLCNCFFKEEFNNGKLNQGTGIGLSLSKRLIEMHKGTFYIESTPEKGSNFWFTLPLEH